MVRTGRRRDELPLAVQPIPGDHEKGVRKDPPCLYQEPTQVSLGEKPKACRDYPGARELGKLAS